MPTISIRPAQPGDVRFIVDLVAELAAYEKAPEQALATPERLRELMFGPDARVEALIGLIDGQPQGVALYFMNFSSWVCRYGLYLEDLFVRPSARGAGLGKALLVRLAQIADERGCHRMEWLVIDWNTPAHEFYRAMGAKAMDGWTIWRMDQPAIKALASS